MEIYFCHVKLTFCNVLKTDCNPDPGIAVMHGKMMTSRSLALHLICINLTLSEPAYDIFVLWFRPKNSSFRLPYQHPSSSANCARELFKGLNGSASLIDCARKNFFGWGVRIFCDWRHKWSSFRVILAHVPWPRAQPLGQSVSLKFSLETFDRLSSVSGSKVMI